MEICIYLNNYFWQDFKAFDLLPGGIINDFLLFKNLGFSQNLGFGLEREHSLTLLAGKLSVPI